MRSIVFYWINLVITVLFTIEAIMKIIFVGFLFNGPDSYLRLGWNVIDLLSIFSGISDFLIIADSSFIKIIRILRIMRPLRLIKKNPGLKICIEAIISSIPGVFNLVVILLFILAISAIVGVNLYRGKFYKC